MDNKSEKHWNNINDFLSQAGENLSILEEEVDITVQKEYFALIKKLGQNTTHFQKICKQYIENINDLFDEQVDENIKKQMLAVLATVDDISIFRSIESFAKQDTPLQKWAVIALQQSRMLIQSALLDDPGVFISTGLGGQGMLLRYFCVFLNRDNMLLQDFQQKTLRNETELSIAPFRGVIEQVEYKEGYNTMLMLLPLDIDLKELFEKIIDECNQYGNFLHDNMIITNVKKLSEKEIADIVTKKH